MENKFINALCAVLFQLFRSNERVGKEAQEKRKEQRGTRGKGKRAYPIQRRKTTDGGIVADDCGGCG